MPPATADPEPDAPPAAAAEEEDPAASDWRLRQQQAAEFDRLNRSLVFLALELAAELKVRVFAASECFMRLFDRVADVVVDCEQRVSHWLDSATCAAAESGLPCKHVAVPAPATHSLPPQQMNFIADSFGDIKTELQLLHASMQNLKAAEQDGQYQTETRLRRLQEQLTRMSISASRRPAAGRRSSHPLFPGRPADRLPPSLLDNSETGRYYRHGNRERLMPQLRRVELPR
ncbi:hypothetical protein BBJ28_00024273 [Nothophytophthora sp. Chile5]|nr:hypothetical protein BBJ28_00024273 [Nothophytophthora sp. Chile5]